MTKRKFKPRKNLPKDELIKCLQEGMTLADIARRFGVATSYISEYLKMLNIDIKGIQGRDEKKKEYKAHKKKNSFMKEFWFLIRYEIGR